LCNRETWQIHIQFTFEVWISLKKRNSACLPDGAS
jgi:hypothetical protein